MFNDISTRRGGRQYIQAAAPDTGPKKRTRWPEVVPLPNEHISDWCLTHCRDDIGRARMGLVSNLSSRKRTPNV